MINEFVEKLKERLGEYEYSHLIEHNTEVCLHCQGKDDDWCNCVDCSICVWDKAKAIGKELAEEYKDVPDTNVGKWIPVSEALPDEESEVIVSTKTERVKVGIYTKKYGFEMREGFMCDDGFMYINTSNAWQPLPQPYKGE